MAEVSDKELRTLTRSVALAAACGVKVAAEPRIIEGLIDRMDRAERALRHIGRVVDPPIPIPARFRVDQVRSVLMSPKAAT